MAKRGRISVLSVALLICALAALSIGDPSSGSASPGGVQNPGFELGLTSWTATAVDAAVVVGTETSTSAPTQCPTYADMGGVSVQPYKGAKSLREGTCRRINQSQPKGTNKVSQTFIADSSPLRVAFRLFSWEHRGNDQFSLELKRGNAAVGTLAAAVNVPMAGVPGGRRTCSGALPCTFSIDAGSSGQFVATGWMVATINIPQSAIGQNLTLSYSVIGGKDNSHATWAYFDNVNVPPVARFNVDFADDIAEGDSVQFTGTPSFDPDQPLDAIVAWQWVINGETINEQNPFYIFPDEGTYSACLTVTDTFGDSNQVCSGGTASDGTPVSPLSLTNVDPGVNALDVETLAGQPVELFGRTLEPGWDDTLSAEWRVGGQTTAATVTDDHLPFLSTGTVTKSVTTATDLSGTLTIRDFPDSGVETDDFTVTVVPNDPERDELTNNALAGAPVLVSDKRHISWIGSAGDQDFYEIQLPNTEQPLLPPGGELLVTLKGPGGQGLNADYDLVILSQQPSFVGGFQSGESGQTSMDTAGFRQQGYRQQGFRQQGFRQQGFRQQGFRQQGFRQQGFRQQGSFTYPLSQVGFNGLDGQSIGSADVTLGELGLGTLEGNVTVAAYSANLGTGEEAALVQSDVAGTRFYIGVIGANGAFSNSQPYTLSIESAVPIDPAAALGPEVCSKSPLVGPDPANPPTTIVEDINPDFIPAGGTKTLIITQRERMIALADNPATTGVNEGLSAWSTLEGKLEALAQHSAVQADILSMPSVAYDSWDSNPCDVAEANAVAATIRGEIQSRLSLEPGIQYVVLAGDDDVVPQRRVPDETMIGNEANYLSDAFLKPGSPLFSSLLDGFILTDDYYADDVPSPWLGRELYVPDRPIGRLVETPEEIGAAADAFLTAGPSGGLLDYNTAATALVTGYDFFTDGADAIAANLATKLNTSTLTDAAWTSAQLRCAMLGLASGSLTDCAVRSVIAANAHYTHYAALSANGFAVPDFSDVLDSNETAAAGGATPVLERRVVFTMGCHGGLNVPNRASLPPDAGLGIDPSLDFAQAMARQRAVFIASTGFGLGDDAGLGGTELLLTIFAEEMAEGDAIIGNTLMDAKQSYLLGLLSMTAYDEKSSIQLTMFGLPMYQVDVPETPGSITPLQAEESSGTFTLNVQDGAATTTTTHSIEPVTTSNGTYLTADGDSQVTAFRAIQPRVVIPIPPGSPVRGVLIKSGTYTDEGGVNPVISLPSQDWLLDDTEPQVCLDSFWPAVPATRNSVDPGGGGPQALVVTPGQFRCTSGSAPTVTGVQRKYTSLTVEVLRSTSSDQEPPDVDEVRFVSGEGTSLNVLVEASDASGIGRVVVNKYSAGVITPIELNLPEPFPASGSFTINVPNVGATDDIAGAVVDGAQNVAYFTAKGNSGFDLTPVNAPAIQHTLPGTPTTFTIGVPEFATFVDPFFTMDFGDGQSSSGPVTGATFTVTHTYDPGAVLPTTATVKVMDAEGRLGGDTTSVRLLCDPIGDAPTANFDWVSCDVSTTATTMTIAVQVVGTIQNEGQYRVDIQTATTNAQLKFDNGRAIGPLRSLVVTQGDPSELRFTFDLAEVGLTSGGRLEWSAEAQTVGFPDRMPDSGSKAFVVP